MDERKKTIAGLRRALLRVWSTEKSSVSEVDTSRLPAHAVIVATLEDRLRFQRWVGGIALLLTLGFAFLQLSEKWSAQEALKTQDVLLVPTHIPEFIKVRPNAISDERVFEFAEWVAREVTNMSYLDMEIRSRTVARYMAPELKTSWLREMANLAKKWKRLEIDSVWTFEEIKNFSRKTQNRKEVIAGKERTRAETSFTVQVWGTSRRFRGGKLIQSFRERVTLEFRTSHLHGDKSWIFEVVSVVRKSEQDLLDETAVSDSDFKEEERL